MDHQIAKCLISQCQNGDKASFRLSRLEHDVAIEKHYDRNDAGDETRMLKAYYLLSAYPVLMSGDSIQEDLLRINRKSLNYLLQKIKVLEKENISYRERLRQQYLDTTSE